MHGFDIVVHFLQVNDFNGLSFVISFAYVFKMIVLILQGFMFCLQVISSGLSFIILVLGYV